MARLVNYALYQAGWFLFVLGAASDRAWLGTVLGGLLIVLHCALVPRPMAELKLLLAAGMLGGLLDSAQSCAGLLVFRAGSWPGSIAPPWIVLLWMQFATLLHFGLSFLKGRYVLGTVLAALGGPLAFWAASRLGAVHFPPPASRSLIVLGLVWACALPLLLWLAARWTEPGASGRYRGFGETRAD